MGFYIRKSISVGPLRFNLSKSGIGVSAGIKGFRVGYGPRGNYIHMGRGGLYFRQTLPKANNVPSPRQVEYRSSNITFEEIESGDVNRMTDSSSSTLLAEINSKARMSLIWPWIAGLSLLFLFGTRITNAPAWVFFLLVPLFALATGYSIYRDKMRKTVVLFYQLEPHVENAYQSLHYAIESFRSCSSMWHISSSGKIRTTYDWKVNAGAGALIKRRSIRPEIGSPPYFKSNISIPCIAAGRQKLYFLPDRILVWDTAGVGAVNYDQVNVDFRQSKFIEDGSVPPESPIVGSTWRYVNKKGGPDRRFSDNREIPIVLYEEVMVTSKSGLQELFQISKSGIGATFSAAIKGIDSAIKECETDPREEFIKSSCGTCSGSIEFPIQGIGQVISCPHCNAEILLMRPEMLSS